MDIQPHIDEWYSYCDEFSTGNDPKSLTASQTINEKIV